MILSPSILKLPVASKWSAPAVSGREGGPTPPSVAPVLTVTASEYERYMAYLNWSPSDKTDSEGFGYTVQTRFNGGGWIVMESGITDNYYIINPANSVMPEGLYEYRIIPQNNVSTGPASNIQGFTVVEEESSGSDDPLEGLFNRLRLQTYRSKESNQIASYVQTVQVSGAGTSEVNGRYHLVSGTFVNSAGYYFVDQEATGQFWIKHASVYPYEFYLQPSVDNPNPWDSFYVQANGIAPAPTVVSYMEPQYTAIGINPGVDAVNATWTDEITSTGQASQSNAIQRFSTGYERGVPVLIGDGVDDCMATPVAGNILNTRGAMWMVWRVNDGGTLNGQHVIGGLGGGPSFSSNAAASQWGLYKTAGWGTRLPITTTADKWVSFACSWDGTDFRYHCVSQGVNEAKSGTLTNAFTASSSLPFSIAGRYTNTGVLTSYLPGRYIAACLDDRYLSAADLQRAAEHGATLFPSS